MRAPAHIPDDVSVKNSIGDQPDGNHEALELDSLIGSDDAAEMVFLPFHATGREPRTNIRANSHAEV